MAEQPVLQLIHVSDLHIKSPHFDNTHGTERIMRLLRRMDQYGAVLGPYFPERMRNSLVERCREMARSLEDGMCGHAPRSIERFTEFVRAVTLEDDDWRERTTWIIDTGDLSTYGDNVSLQQGLHHLQAFANAAGGVVHYRIHGNHDAWPTTHPLIAGHGTIAPHRQALRDNHYTYTAPSEPLEFRLPGGHAQILLYRLNSVLHDRFKNALALGEIQHDRYWEHAGVATPGVQIQALMEDAVNRVEADGPALRIVLSHHPIEEPDHFNYRYAMRLINDRDILRVLGERLEGSEVGQLAHLIMSGHTHQLYPAQGALEHQADEPAPLTQLVVGSLSKIYSVQHAHFAARDEPPDEVHKSYASQYPHQCELLRFYYDLQAPRRVRMERLIAARVYGAGRYTYIRRNGQLAESVTFDL